VRLSRAEPRHRRSADREKPLARSAGERRPRRGFSVQLKTIQRLIHDPHSLDILEGKFSEGQTIRVEQRNGALAFEAA